MRGRGTCYGSSSSIFLYSIRRNLTATHSTRLNASSPTAPHSSLDSTCCCARCSPARTPTGIDTDRRRGVSSMANSDTGTPLRPEFESARAKGRLLLWGSCYGGSGGGGKVRGLRAKTHVPMRLIAIRRMSLAIRRPRSRPRRMGADARAAPECYCEAMDLKPGQTMNFILAR